MAAPPCSSIILLSITTLISSLLLHTQSAPSGPINITEILDRAGQYTSFIRLLSQTQAGAQINNQVSNSYNGITVFAPTDNAFSNLPAGSLNNLNDRQLAQLVLYHICPQFYSLKNLRTVSNPVRTQAIGLNDDVLGLYFTGEANRINVSTGIMEVPIYNSLRKDFPLAVYQVDEVLMPRVFYETKTPAALPPSSGARGGGGSARKGGDGAGGNAIREGGDGMAPSTGNGTKSGGGAARDGGDGISPSKGNGTLSGDGIAPSTTGNGTIRGGGAAREGRDGIAPAAMGNGTISGGGAAGEGGDGIAPSTGNLGENGSGKISEGAGLLVVSFWLLCMAMLI